MSDPRTSRRRHIADQVEAASGHVMGAMLSEAQAQGSPLLLQMREDLPAWAPKAIKQACPHIGDRPMPVVALLADPENVLCPRCGFAAHEAWVDANPDICDLCRQPPPGNLFREAILSHMMVVFIGNVCPTCFDSLTA